MSPKDDVCIQGSAQVQSADARVELTTGHRIAIVHRPIAGTSLMVERDRSGALIVRPLAAGAVQTPEIASGEPTASGEIVVIAPFSDGVERSQGVKRNADSIADAVIAADIGKLPAFNAAEALQRGSGVTIVREVSR